MAELIYEYDEDTGTWIVRNNVFPGIVGMGETEDEALENLNEELRAIIEAVGRGQQQLDNLN